MRTEGVEHSVYAGDDTPKDQVHSDCGTADFHGLLKRYSAGEIGAYVVIAPTFVHERHEYLIVFKHHVRTLDYSEPSSVVVERSQADSYNGRRDQSMLVGIVQALQCPERIVVWGRSKANVGLFSFDSTGYKWGDALYHSARSGTIPVRCFEDRELVPSAVLQNVGVTSRDNQLVNQVVQCRPALVQSLSRQQHERRVRGANVAIPNCDQPRDGDPVLSVWLESDAVRFEVSEGLKFPVKVLDVGYGPIELQHNAF